MKNSGFKVVLYEPEIPQNTGNIARLCACTGSDLYLVGKLGFSLDEKHIKRAGLDYWDSVNIKQVQTLEELFEEFPDDDKFFLTTKATQSHFQANFTKGSLLIFGPETRGLPIELIKANFDKAFRIPMIENQRSLNLSNSVAITLYEAIRQTGNIEY
ncbi:MAG: tRNA (cytidine(34)-2'-O)-methyltransferase [Candidatus Gastranaerophilales bacterium]|nr:tRNA (cytidine(34)-2'-O)-methyltransferase [Candidatus Gastranaerophilales bacterium]